MKRIVYSTPSLGGGEMSMKSLLESKTLMDRFSITTGDGNSLSIPASTTISCKSEPASMIETITHDPVTSVVTSLAPSTSLTVEEKKCISSATKDIDSQMERTQMGSNLCVDISPVNASKPKGSYHFTIDGGKLMGSPSSRSKVPLSKDQCKSETSKEVLHMASPETRPSIPLNPPSDDNTDERGATGNLFSSEISWSTGSMMASKISSLLNSSGSGAPLSLAQMLSTPVTTSIPSSITVTPVDMPIKQVIKTQEILPLSSVAPGAPSQTTITLSSQHHNKVAQNFSELSTAIPASKPESFSGDVKTLQVSARPSEIAGVTVSRGNTNPSAVQEISKDSHLADTKMSSPSVASHLSKLLSTENKEEKEESAKCEERGNVLLKQLLENTSCSSSQFSISINNSSILTSKASQVPQPPLPLTCSSPTTPCKSPVITTSAAVEKSDSIMARSEASPRPQIISVLQAALSSSTSPTSAPPMPATVLPTVPRVTESDAQSIRNMLLATTTAPEIRSASASPMLTTTAQIEEAENLIPKESIKIEKISENDPKPESLSINLSTVKIEKGLLLEPDTRPTSEKMLLADRLDDSNQGDTSKSDEKELTEAELKKKKDLEIKRAKRRLYQQKRRQTQLANKEGISNGTPPKKRQKKVTKVDEDYDSYIENLMTKLRLMGPAPIMEPPLRPNFNVCSIFGVGELQFPSIHENNYLYGKLTGEFGLATVQNKADYYDSQPFGDIADVCSGLNSQPPLRGFYSQEFSPPPRLGRDTAMSDRKETDSPYSIISSSSPEIFENELASDYPGLKLIQEDDSDDVKDRLKKCISPVIPLLVPIPIRAKMVTKVEDQDKENFGAIAPFGVKSRLGQAFSNPLKESGNVTVTLTLTSQAAENVIGVLNKLADILKIVPPSTYQVVERTTTPPSQKLGLYKKGKDGKENDLQSILKGPAKFCRHCDVVVLNQAINKKVHELPCMSVCETDKNEEITFCSSTCYMQFALTHRSITEEKEAAAVVNHISDIFGPIRPRFEKVKKEGDSIRPEGGQQRKPGLAKGDTAAVDSKKNRKISGDAAVEPKSKKWKGVRYKWWFGGIIPAKKYRKPTENEMTEMLFRLGICILPSPMPPETRVCLFCGMIGDGVADGPARLLNYDVDKWVHLNCALWAEEVYETTNGALMNVDVALKKNGGLLCVVCGRSGAAVKCFKLRCSSYYHLGCAVKDSCVFYKNKSVYCPQHIPKNEKENELTTLSVFRRVYIDRDEPRQVAAIMHHGDESHLMRVGSLIFLSVGQLLPHQLQNFHTPDYVYPVGYKIIRFFWSMRRVNKRCQYECSILEVEGKPHFQVVVHESPYEDLVLEGSSPKLAWIKILEAIQSLRRDADMIKIFPQYITGEDLFGLTEPAVVKVLESLPGVETLSDYNFKYGRNPLLELPLAINPTGCARSEPKLRTHFKRSHSRRSTVSRAAITPSLLSAFDSAPYSKQLVVSKSSQYKKMRQEWRNNIFLARSKIQGLGLYAARDLEKHTMIIEYIGELIRPEVAEVREKRYESQNRGIYMFRLDEHRVVDATLSGGLARYINHSCNPNCITETVEVERDWKIIIFANRRILRGEELAYDYKFDIEDDKHKIPCLCGAPNCKKWMN